MQSSESTEKTDGRKTLALPRWLKVLLVSFAVTFSLGYLVGLHELEKDSGRLGVPHWYENYWECVGYCIFDAMVVAVLCSALVLMFFGLRLWVRKGR